MSHLFFLLSSMDGDLDLKGVDTVEVVVVGMLNIDKSSKGAPAIECQTGTRLVSPRHGPKKKNASLNN